MVQFALVLRSISQENSLYTQFQKISHIKLKYDLRMKVFTHYITIKTELGADILLIVILWLLTLVKSEFVLLLHRSFCPHFICLATRCWTCCLSLVVSITSEVSLSSSLWVLPPMLLPSCSPFKSDVRKIIFPLLPLVYRSNKWLSCSNCFRI